MPQFIEQVVQYITQYVPNLLGAFAILIVGIVAGWFLSGMVGTALRRTTVDNRIARFFVGADKAETFPIEKWISNLVFYLVLLMTFVAFFQALQLTMVIEPLNAFLNKCFAYAPKIFGALILLVVAWLVAGALKLLLLKALNTIKLDERIGGAAKQEDQPDSEPVRLSETLATMVYWLTLLLFLPAVLNVLDFQFAVQPILAMLNEVLVFLPRLFGAALILVVGWFLSRILQRIATSLVQALGADRLPERFGVSADLGKHRPSRILGMLVQISVLIPVFVAAMDALGLDAITQPSREMLSMLLLALPRIGSAAVILLFTYLFGRVLSNLVVALLVAVGFDKIMKAMGFERKSDVDAATPARIVGHVLLGAMMLLAMLPASEMLGWSSINVQVQQLIAFLSKLGFGLLLLCIGLLIANFVGHSIQASGHRHSGTLSMLARLGIIVFVGSMGLQFMGVGEEVVSIVLGSTLLALAVAFALAFGLGGREVAGQVLNDLYARFKRSGETQ